MPRATPPPAGVTTPEQRLISLNTFFAHENGDFQLSYLSSNKPRQKYESAFKPSMCSFNALSFLHREKSQQFQTLAHRTVSSADQRSYWLSLY